MESPFISSNRLVLRLATVQDIPEIINYYCKNQAYLAPWQNLHSEVFTAEYWHQQVIINLQEFQAERSLKLFIFKNTKPEEIIGNIGFHGILRGAAHFCYLGYTLAEKEQHQGYMHEALQAAINYVFTRLNLHRVMANYMPQNQRSANVLTKIGFVEEGYAKDYLYIHGQWQDHILTSLTNKNWYAG